MTFAQTLSVMTQRLSSAGIPDAAFDAKQLLCARSGFAATAFLLHRGDDMPPALAAEAERCVTRRINGEPLQYILGEWTFLDTSFAVGPGVLIPRPETEALVLQCADLLRGRNAPVIYDLCAGSGCIGLSLKKLSAVPLPEKPEVNTPVPPPFPRLHLHRCTYNRSDGWVPALRPERPCSAGHWSQCALPA